MTSVLLVGLAAGIVTLTVTRGEIFEPLRHRLRGRLGYLVSCPLCLGFWLSGALTALQGVDVGTVPLVGWWASWGVSTALAVAVDRLSSTD